jgi:hypothetical protein
MRQTLNASALARCRMDNMQELTANGSGQISRTIGTTAGQGIALNSP